MTIWLGEVVGREHRQLIAGMTIGDSQRIVWAVTFSPTGAESSLPVSTVSFSFGCRAGLERVGDRLEGHEDRVVSLAYSPEGDSTRPRARRDHPVVGVESGQQAPDVLTGHTDDVTSVASSPDGQRIVPGGMDGTVRQWPAVAGRNELCDKSTGNMSQKQWDVLVSSYIDHIKVCPHLPDAAD